MNILLIVGLLFLALTSPAYAQGKPGNLLALVRDGWEVKANGFNYLFLQKAKGFAICQVAIAEAPQGP
jgi:hypothetical protein